MKYTCEICGSSFSEGDKCLAHEMKHRQVSQWVQVELTYREGKWTFLQTDSLGSYSPPTHPPCVHRNVGSNGMLYFWIVSKNDEESIRLSRMLLVTEAYTFYRAQADELDGVLKQLEDAKEANQWTN